MGWLKDSLEGQRVVDTLPQQAVFPTGSLGEQMWRALRRWSETTASSREVADVSRRLSTHLALVTGVVVLLLFVRFGLFATAAPTASSHAQAAAAMDTGPTSAPQLQPTPDDPRPPAPPRPLAYSFLPHRPLLSDTLSPQPLPHTATVNRPRTEIAYYKVQEGDTVWGIASKFGLKPKTVEWANSLELNPDLLRVGQKLVIPPVDGVIHLVEPGDTLIRLARKYKVKPQDIVAYPPNGLKSINDPLPVGKQLIIPGGIKPFVRPVVRMYSGPIPKGARRGSGNFVWPTTGRITSLFGQIVCSPMYGCRPHMGIDIANIIGTPVVASDSGYVVFAGWDRTGYGKMVIINHGNGFATVYAHLSAILVRKGRSVARGQRIGSIGATGNVTGSHLHFEIRQHGRQRNPLGFLPRP